MSDLLLLASFPGWVDSKNNTVKIGLQQRRYDTRLSSRGWYVLIEARKTKKSLKMHSNNDIQLVASKRHKESIKLSEFVAG